MKPDETPRTSPRMVVAPTRLPGLLALLAVWGPGLLVMLADTDAGNIIAAAQSGTQWGYRLLPLPLLLIPMLYMVQELAARIGLFGGRGFGEMVRERFGRFWAWIAVAALATATLSSLVTEFDGIAGVGELYGLPRWVALTLTASCLLAVVLSGEYRSVERVAITIGLFELSFFFVAWAASPRGLDIARDVVRQPFGDPGYLYLGAALIGATFNPWMIFYQPSALAEKGVGPAHHTTVRWDTAIGAILTQLVTAAVLVAAAATLGASGPREGGLASVGEISEALTPFLGIVTGRLVFGMGVVGASMVAAIVCSLAFAWGLGEVAGFRRALERQPRDSLWFCITYTLAVAAGAVIVLMVPDLVWLSIASQVVNAMLMPVLVTLLIALAATALPGRARLRGWYLWLVAAICALAAATGLTGAYAGLS